MKRIGRNIQNYLELINLCAFTLIRAMFFWCMFISSQKCCLGNGNMFFYRLTVKLLPKYSVRFGCVGTSTQPRPVGLQTLNQMHRFKRMPRYFRIQNFCKNPQMGMQMTCCKAMFSVPIQYTFLVEFRIPLTFIKDGINYRTYVLHVLLISVCSCLKHSRNN